MRLTQTEAFGMEEAMARKKKDRRHENPGRPPLPVEDRNAAREHKVRVSIGVDDMARAAAEEAGLTLNEWWKTMAQKQHVNELELRPKRTAKEEQMLAEAREHLVGELDRILEKHLKLIAAVEAGHVSKPHMTREQYAAALRVQLKHYEQQRADVVKNLS
jgi:hypothetical protein